jgi:hypothetical protein
MEIRAAEDAVDPTADDPALRKRRLLIGHFHVRFTMLG